MKNVSTAIADNNFVRDYSSGGGLKQSPSQKTFSVYLFKENKLYSILIVSFCVCQFYIFKLCYPYPDFFSDSYSYIFAALAHLDANIWPIGYSKFLSGFHWVTHSATALNFFQYLFFELIALYFYHTIVYFFHTGNNTRRILCFFLFFNPLNLYLANYVSSDTLFIAVSLLWVTELIWIIYRPKVYQVFLQGIIVFIAFTIRYNAMYYPLISVVVFILSKHRVIFKIGGMILAPALILPFILFSRSAAKHITGTAQFPILGGWQWANNALYMREFIEEDSTKFPTKETAELDEMARTFYRTVPKEDRDLPNYVANFFIRQGKAPLKRYMHTHYEIKSDYENVVAWGKVSPIYSQYGLYLIKRHPLAFFQHFILVNTKNYFLPPLEKLEIYNLGQDKMWPIAAYWFDYTDVTVKSISKYLQNLLLIIFTPLFLVLNIFCGINLSRFLLGKYVMKSGKEFANLLFTIGLLLILNFGFSVFANIIVIRYQIFPMFVLLSLGVLLNDYIQVMKNENPKVTIILKRPEAFAVNNA
jgi:hypothetical protein